MATEGRPGVHITVRVGEAESGGDFEPHELGELHVRRVEGEIIGWEMDAWQRPGLDAGEAADFLGFIKRVARQLSQTGNPHGNGWSPASDGGWYMTADVVNMPPDPFV